MPSVKSIFGIVLFLIATGVSAAFAIVQGLAFAAAWSTVPVIGPLVFLPVLAWTVVAVALGVFTAIWTRVTVRG